MSPSRSILRALGVALALSGALAAEDAAPAPGPTTQAGDSARAQVSAAVAADQGRRQEQTLRRATELQGSGAGGEAVAVLQAHLERWPNDELIRQALLQAQISQLEAQIRVNLTDQAQTKDLIIGDPDYEAARERSAEEVQKRLATVEYFVQQHHYPQAVDACDAILKDHPGHPAVLTIKLNILKLLEKTVMEERVAQLAEKEVKRDERLNEVIDHASMPHDKESQPRTVLIFAEDIAEAERARIRAQLQERFDLVQDNVEVRKVIETLFAVAGLNYVLLDSAVGSETLSIHMANETVETLLQTVSKQVKLQFNYTGGTVYVTADDPTNAPLVTEIIRVDSGLTNVLAKPTLEQFGAQGGAGGSGGPGGGVPGPNGAPPGLNFGDQGQNGGQGGGEGDGKSDLERFLEAIKDSRIIVGWPQGGDIYLDKKSNTVYVRSTPSCIVELKRLLHAMDYDSTQVLIEARFVEVTDQANRQLGTNLITQTQVKNVQIGGANNAAGLTLPPADPPGAPSSGFAAVIGGSGFGSFPDFRAAITALETSNEANTLSEPKILTLNNAQGIISLTHDISYIGNYQQQTQPTTTSGGVGTVITNTSTVLIPQFQKDEEKIELKISPSVARNSDVITLDVVPSVRQLIQLRQVPFSYVPTSGSTTLTQNIEQPEFDTRTLHTALHVQSGQTIVLGGLIKENDAKTTSGTPFLSRIPVLGYLFGTKSKSHDRRHLLIFVTAHLISPDGAKLDDRLRVLRDTARVVVPENPPEQQRPYGAAPNRDEPAVSTVAPAARPGDVRAPFEKTGRGR